MAVDAVLFDLDDTLLDGDAAWAAGMDAVLRRSPGVDRQAAFDAWEAVFHDSFDAYLAGQLTLEESRIRRVRLWAEALSIAVQPGEELDWFDAYLAGYEAGWHAFDDVASTLRQLGGLKLGVVTNGDGTQQRAKLEALNLDVTFDAIVVSSEVGVAKPDPRIFHTAAELLGVPPERCVFVGDRRDVDARGARAAGMQAVWLNRRGVTVEGDGAENDELSDIISIASLAELTAHLGALANELEGSP